MLDQIFAGLSDDELAQLSELMDKLNTSLKEKLPDHEDDHTGDIDSHIGALAEGLMVITAMACHRLEALTAILTDMDQWDFLQRTKI